MRRGVLVALCLLAAANTSAAAPATAPGAQALADAFHRYLGPARAGQADFIRVEPQGEAYRVTLDLQEFVRPLQAFEFGIDPAEIAFLAQPLPEGTWHVSDMRLPTLLRVHVKEEAISYRFDGISFEGTYDPALAAFSKFVETISPMSVETVGPGARSTTHYGTQDLRGTAAAAEAGASDVTINQMLGSLSASQEISIPTPASPAATPFALTYAVGATKADVSIKAIESTKLLDLWAYGVARGSETPPKVDNAEVKRLLTDILPVFRKIEESVTLEALHVETPIGDFGVGRSNVALAFTGLLSNGELRAAIDLSGPSYPEAIVPDWARQFIPTTLETGVDLSGYDLDAPARLLIQRLDFGKKPVIDDADFAAAMLLARPPGGVKLELEPTKIHGPLLDIEAAGAMTLTATTPTGAFNVTITGLDAAAAALQAVAGDPAASQALAAISALKTYARRTDAGADFFAIELRGDGAVTVNGSVVKPPADKAL